MRELIRLNPVFTHNIWGGTRLREVFGYDVRGSGIGECWGVAAHEKGDCTVASGRFGGLSLSQLWNGHRELFGGLCGSRFPLLIKIIDAKSRLSIQVHPDDAYAAAHENGASGKTECWYILDCPKDARLVIGHRAQTAEELSDMISGGRWDELIREVPVKKGDFLQIEPGTVHAIMGGVLILETQQNSDVTYRVYDYDRTVNGQKRPLHIAKCLDVITVPAAPAEESVICAAPKDGDGPVTLIACSHYRVFLLPVHGYMCWEQTYPFLAVSVTEGSGKLNGEPLKKGDHLIVPFGYGRMEFAGEMELIASTVNGD